MTQHPLSSPGLDAARLLAAAVAMVTLVAIGDGLLAAAVQRTPEWKQGSLDPRERILWDRRPEGSPVVLVGDSVFCSYYVDAPHQTLWARLSGHLRRPVFSAALNGATPADMLLIARRVAARWPPGTLALIAVHPARIFAPDAPVPAASHYAARLEDPGPLASFLTDRFFSIRDFERLHQYLDGSLRPETAYFRTLYHRDRRWDEDAYALVRFRDLEKAFGASAHRLRVGFDWLRSMDGVLRGAGLLPVFVLTPLNSVQMTAHAGGNFTVPRALAASRAHLLDRLRASGLDHVDLQSALDSSSFADLIHPNARGEDVLAARLSREAGVRTRGAAGR